MSSACLHYDWAKKKSEKRAKRKNKGISMAHPVGEQVRLSSRHNPSFAFGFPVIEVKKKNSRQIKFI